MANVAFGIKWLDYDNDGWLDLVIANGHTSDNVAETNPGLTYRQTSQLFHNDHGTHLTPVTDAGEAFARPIVGRGLAVGDYDNDGRPDLLIVDSEGKPLLLHNETPNAGHWLSLTLVGRKCNRDGIGAEVIARTPGLVQHRFCHTDGSYLSASDRRVLIGLGKATQADLTVRWPDGRTATLRNVAADRQVAVKE